MLVGIQTFNFICKGPTTRFPFGIEKLKNMVVLIPAGLFVYFGAKISMEAVTKFIHYSHLEHDMDISPVSLGVFLFNISNI